MGNAAGMGAFAESWADFMVRGLVDGSVVFAIALFLWLPLRKLAPAHLVYGLFLLVLAKLALPFKFAVPGWLASLSPTYLLGNLMDQWAAEPLPAPLTASTALGAPVELPPSLGSEVWLLVGWGAVVVTLLLRFTLIQVQTRIAVKRARPLTGDELFVDLRGLCRAAGISRPVRFFVSDALSSPAAGGLLRPYVLIPDGLSNQLPARQMSWVLLHELAHIKRGDLWVCLVQRLVQIAFFFHPAVWMANWIIDEQREYACDDAALTWSKARPQECGQGFLSVVEWSHARSSDVAATLGMFGANTVIRRRLMRILDGRRKVSGRGTALSTAFLLTVALFVLPTVTAQDRSPEEEVQVAVVQEPPQDPPSGRMQTLRSRLERLERENEELRQQLEALIQRRSPGAGPSAAARPEPEARSAPRLQGRPSPTAQPRSDAPRPAGTPRVSLTPRTPPTPRTAPTPRTPPTPRTAPTPRTPPAPRAVPAPRTPPTPPRARATETPPEPPARLRVRAPAQDPPSSRNQERGRTDAELRARIEDEMRRVQQEVERVQEEAQAQVRRIQEEMAREMRRVQEEVQRVQQEAQNEVERVQREVQRAQREAETETRRMQEEAQREMGRVQEEVQRAQQEAEREARRAREEAQRARQRAETEARAGSQARGRSGLRARARSDEQRAEETEARERQAEAEAARRRAEERQEQAEARQEQAEARRAQAEARRQQAEGRSDAEEEARREARAAAREARNEARAEARRVRAEERRAQAEERRAQAEERRAQARRRGRGGVGGSSTGTGRGGGRGGSTGAGRGGARGSSTGTGRSGGGRGVIRSDATEEPPVRTGGRVIRSGSGGVRVQSDDGTTVIRSGGAGIRTLRVTPDAQDVRVEVTPQGIKPIRVDVKDGTVIRLDSDIKPVIITAPKVKPDVKVKSDAKAVIVSPKIKADSDKKIR